MARIIQKAHPENPGERRMLQWLVSLPDDWTVFCELRLDATFQSETADLAERRPDFVVVAPEVGLVSIEVKHWNLDRNSYVWVDQRRIRRDPDGVLVDNPWHQAFVYGKCFERLMNGGIWVTSLVAFPLLESARLWNQLGDPRTLAAPQARMLLDWRKTLFRDQVDQRPGGIRQALREAVEMDSRFYRADNRAVEAAVDRLIPAEFRVGDASARRIEERRQLRILSERQQAIAFGMPRGTHCLLDLAGSGKTNVLVSRALHLARTAADGQEARVLILTYNRKLARAIRHMLEDKCRGERLPRESFIEVLAVEDALAAAVAAAYGVDSDEIEAVLQPEATSRSTRFDKLVKAFNEVAPELGDRLRCYDAVLVDEIQDFGPAALTLIKLLQRGDELFIVGDLAQRIYSQRLEVYRLNVDLDRARVAAEFTMYRCPPRVADMAHGFASEDPILRTELQNHGYGSAVRFRGKIDTLPMVQRAVSAIDEEGMVVDAVRRHCGQGIPLTEMMVVTAPRRVSRIGQALRQAGVPTRADPDSFDGVLVVSFLESKGLEAEVVVLSGLEELPVRRRHGPLSGRQVTHEEESLSRRQAYVALTRTTGYLVWIYEDPDHRLVADLLRHVQRVLRGAVS